MKPMRVSKFEEGISSKDGKIVRFNVHLTDGATLALELPTANIGTLITFLAGLAQFAERNIPQDQLNALRERGKGGGHSITPLAFGIFQGSTPAEIVLSVQLGQFSLGFPMTPTQVSMLREALAQIPPAPTHAQTKH